MYATVNIFQQNWLCLLLIKALELNDQQAEKTAR